MNSVIENILTRQTIREYTDEQIPDELLDIVLQAAIRAPPVAEILSPVI